MTAEGGLDALKAVKTHITIGHSTLISPQETFNGGMTTVVVYPDKIARQFTIGGNTVYRTLVGEDVWIFTTKARQVTVLTGALRSGRPNPEGTQLKMLLEADPVAFLVVGSDSSAERTVLDPLEGMPRLKVKLANGHIFKAYFNAQTSLLEKLIYNAEYYGEMTVKHSDFRPVTGIQIPFKMETFRGSTKTEQQLVADVKLNTPVPENAFRAPQ